MMGNAFYPDEWLDSAYDIPYEQLPEGNAGDHI